MTELFGISIALAGLVAASAVRVRASRVRAAVSCRLSPEVIEVRELAVLELFIESTGLVPTPAGRVQLLPTGGGRHRILVPALAPGERATVAIGLDTSRRGQHRIAGYDVVLTDGLGLAGRRLVSTGRLEYLVRPRTEELLRTLPLGAAVGGQESSRSAAERIITGASMLRGYVPGDDLRRVHWPTTARVGELMVREGGEPDSADRSGTTIVLGTNRGGGAAFERAVEIVASLAAVAHKEGMVRVVTTGGYDSGLASGPEHLESIGLQLATVQARDAPPPGRLPRQGGEQSSRAEARGLPWAESDSAEALALHIFGRGPARAEWNVLLAVEGVASLAETEVSPAVLDELAGRVGAIVRVLVGGEVPRLERLARDEIAVFLPVGRAMGDVWNMALDLPVGEARAVDTAEVEAELARRAQWEAV